MGTSNRIMEIRKSKGVTREELASRLGISVSGLGKYERGERRIDIPMIEQIADKLGVSVLDLLSKEIDHRHRYDVISDRIRNMDDEMLIEVEHYVDYLISRDDAR